MLHQRPDNESPDNLDAIVWAITHLALGKKKKGISATSLQIKVDVSNVKMVIIMHLKKSLALITVAVLVISLVSFNLTCLAQEGENAGNEVASDQNYPKFGAGSQFIYPSGGISIRVWLDPTYGLEANSILWSDPHFGLDGTASVRLLLNITKNRVVNFYLVMGGAYNLQPGFISAIGAGGINFSVISDELKVNIEFGIQGRAVDNFGMTFGSGFHYYF